MEQFKKNFLSFIIYFYSSVWFHLVKASLQAIWIGCWSFVYLFYTLTYCNLCCNNMVSKCILYFTLHYTLKLIIFFSLIFFVKELKCNFCLSKRKLGILTDHFFYMVRRPLWKVMKTIERGKSLFDKIQYNFFIENWGENRKKSIHSWTKSVKIMFLLVYNIWLLERYFSLKSLKLGTNIIIP